MISNMHMTIKEDILCITQINSQTTKWVLHTSEEHVFQTAEFRELLSHRTRDPLCHGDVVIEER